MLKVFYAIFISLQFYFVRLTSNFSIFHEEKDTRFYFDGNGEKLSYNASMLRCNDINPLARLATFPSSEHLRFFENYLQKSPCKFWSYLTRNILYPEH